MVISESDYQMMLARTQKPVPKSERHESDGGAEEILHYKIIEFCKSKGWMYFHGSMIERTRRTIGEPDFTILADKGRVFFVECKTGTGKLSPAQLGAKMMAEKLGHAIHTVRSFEQFTELVSAK